MEEVNIPKETVKRVIGRGKEMKTKETVIPITRTCNKSERRYSKRKNKEREIQKVTRKNGRPKKR